MRSLHLLINRPGVKQNPDLIHLDRQSQAGPKLGLIRRSARLGNKRSGFHGSSVAGGERGNDGDGGFGKGGQVNCGLISRRAGRDQLAGICEHTLWAGGSPEPDRLLPRMISC